MEFQRLQATSEADIAKSNARTKAAQKDLTQLEKVRFDFSFLEFARSVLFTVKVSQ